MTEGKIEARQDNPAFNSPGGQVTDVESLEKVKQVIETSLEAVTATLEKYYPEPGIQSRRPHPGQSQIIERDDYEMDQYNQSRAEARPYRSRSSRQSGGSTRSHTIQRAEERAPGSFDPSPTLARTSAVSPPTLHPPATPSNIPPPAFGISDHASQGPSQSRNSNQSPPAESAQGPELTRENLQEMSLSSPDRPILDPVAPGPPPAHSLQRSGRSGPRSHHSVGGSNRESYIQQSAFTMAEASAAKGPLDEMQYSSGGGQPPAPMAPVMRDQPGDLPAGDDLQRTRAVFTAAMGILSTGSDACMELLMDTPRELLEEPVMNE